MIVLCSFEDQKASSSSSSKKPLQDLNIETQSSLSSMIEMPCLFVSYSIPPSPVSFSSHKYFSPSMKTSSSSDLFLLHEIDKDSTTKLERKSSSDLFNFGNFEFVDLSKTILPPKDNPDDSDSVSCYALAPVLGSQAIKLAIPSRALKKLQSVPSSKTKTSTPSIASVAGCTALFNYRVQGAYKFGFYEFFKKCYPDIANLLVGKGIRAATVASLVKTLGRRSQGQLEERVHFCDRCDFPIATYGRLSLCEHALCLD
ncbi:Zinc finger, RING/FYVE/PHD-type [Sesbania bispinosa]|nr:Zinc finger, RING/FYVE/PHD-type [Sesbania bispinosa]